MKTQILKTVDAIIEHLESLTNDELVSIHNEYARENDYDDEIYNNDEDFFNTHFEGKVMEAVRAVSFGEYRYQDNFVKFDGYANLQTFNNPSPHVDIPTIAADILENPENYYDIELIDCFVIDGIAYEGNEDDLREEYDSYKSDTEEENEALEEGEEQATILSFEEWVKENIAIAE